MSVSKKARNMTADEFVSCIRREILEANLATYRDTLERSLSEPGFTDDYWRRAGELYRSLNDEQRRQLLGIMRQVSLDTLSSILGVLDGSALLEKHRDYFHLRYGDEPQELNGELQDLFLSAET